MPDTFDELVSRGFLCRRIYYIYRLQCVYNVITNFIDDHDLEVGNESSLSAGCKAQISSLIELPPPKTASLQAIE